MHGIRLAGDFERLRRAGRTVRSGGLRIRALLDDVDGSYVAFAIGRSYGNAVQRNRIKRRLRNLLVMIDRDGGLAPGWYLFSVGHGVEERHLESMNWSELGHVVMSGLNELSGV